MNRTELIHLASELIHLASELPQGSGEHRKLLAKEASSSSLGDLLNGATAQWLSEAARVIEREVPRELGVKVKFDKFLSGTITVKGPQHEMRCSFRGGEYLMVRCKGTGPGYRFDEELQAAGFDGATMAKRKFLPLLLTGSW